MCGEWNTVGVVDAVGARNTAVMACTSRHPSALYAGLPYTPLYTLLCSVHLTYILHSLSTRSLITCSTLLSSLIENTRQD